jgi:hypothetical protein
MNEDANEESLMLARTIRVAAFAAALYAIATTAAWAEEPPGKQGKLLWRDDTCFFFVLKFEGDGFGLYEFLGGPSPMVGHTFEGNLQTFGTRKIMNATENKATMVYSETFTDTKPQMEKKIPRQCKKKKEFEALQVE